MSWLPCLPKLLAPTFAKRRTLTILVAVCLLAAAPNARAADDLPKPTGPVILTVTGQIAKTNAPGRTEFDRAMLEALGMKTIATVNSWLPGQHEYAGPAGKALLEAVGAKGSGMTAIAINDYKVEIPVADFEKYPVILAMKLDGEYMTVRNKGPLWVIYPHDEFPELRTQANDAKWIWQLKAIDVH